MIPNHCYTTSNDLWDNSVFCDSSISLRSILFKDAKPTVDFNAIEIKANLMIDGLENVTLESST